MASDIGNDECVVPEPSNRKRAVFTIQPIITMSKAHNDNNEGQNRVTHGRTWAFTFEEHPSRGQCPREVAKNARSPRSQSGLGSRQKKTGHRSKVDEVLFIGPEPNEMSDPQMYRPHGMACRVRNERRNGRFKEEEARQTKKSIIRVWTLDFIEEVGTHDKARRYLPYSLHHPRFLRLLHHHRPH